MPRKALVEKEDAIRTVEKFIEHFRTDDLPKFTSQVWVDMSKDLNQKWTPHCVYVAVRENRRNILTIARKNQGIVMPEDVENENISRSSTSSSVAKIKKKPDIENQVRAHLKSLKTWYYLTLDGDLWDKVKPRATFKYGEKQEKYEISTPTDWTEAIFDAFYDEFHFPCAYILKRAKVYTSRESLNYIEIYAACISQTCSNRFMGFVEKEPWYGEPLDIKIKTWDTTADEHEIVYRPVRSIKRQISEEEDLLTQTTSNRKKRAAKKINVKREIDNGDNDHVEIKYENGEFDLGDPVAGDLFENIVDIKTIPEHHDFIQQVGYIPFNVCYTTPRQMEAYNEYCSSEEWSFVKIDMRQDLIRKITRKFNSQSKNMFFLSLVFNFSGNPFLACQMISETVDFPLLGYWLGSWIQNGARKPKEAVSNYSRVLLSAMCLAFNEFSLEHYVAGQFAAITDCELSEYEWQGNPPKTHIRVDLTNLLNSISQWKCFGKVNHPCIREFYIRCVDLIIEAQNFDEFSELLSLTIVVAVNAREDSILDMKKSTPRIVRKQLEAIIASNKKIIEIPDYNLDNYCKEEIIDLKNAFVDSDKLKPLTAWIETIVQEAKSLKNQGTELNAFYLPEFSDNLLSLALDFPLWTKFTAPSEQITTSYVDDFHRDWEPRILQRIPSNSQFPVRADHFVKAHIDEIGESLTTFDSLMANYNVERVSTHGKLRIKYSGNNVEVTMLQNKEDNSSTEYFEDDKNDTSNLNHDPISIPNQSNDLEIKPNSRNKPQGKDNILSACILETDELGVCRRRNISLDFSEL